jgi:hypothetical protein
MIPYLLLHTWHLLDAQFWLLTIMCVAIGGQGERQRLNTDSFLGWLVLLPLDWGLPLAYARGVCRQSPLDEHSCRIFRFAQSHKGLYFQEVEVVYTA